MPPLFTKSIVCAKFEAVHTPAADSRRAVIGLCSTWAVSNSCQAGQEITRENTRKLKKIYLFSWPRSHKGSEACGQRETYPQVLQVVLKGKGRTKKKSPSCHGCRLSWLRDFHVFCLAWGKATNTAQTSSPGPPETTDSLTSSLIVRPVSSDRAANPGWCWTCMRHMLLKLLLLKCFSLTQLYLNNLAIDLRFFDIILFIYYL